MRGGKVGLAVDRSRFGPNSTGPAGPTGSDDKQEDLPAAALADAQSLTRSRPKARKKGRTRAPETQRRGGYSGPRPDDNDPQPVGNVLAGYVEDLGWARPLASARVFADWAALVGAEVAAHCRPVALSAGELKIAVIVDYELRYPRCTGGKNILTSGLIEVHQSKSWSCP